MVTVCYVFGGLPAQAPWAYMLLLGMCCEDSTQGTGCRQPSTHLVMTAAACIRPMASIGHARTVHNGLPTTFSSGCR
jgi:hypothetical protein